jgi:hypothetical protein
VELAKTGMADNGYQVDQKLSDRTLARPQSQHAAAVANGARGRDQPRRERAATAIRECWQNDAVASSRAGYACGCRWQRLQASWVNGPSALCASAVCAVGYSLQGGFNLTDFRNLGSFYGFECFLIF